MPIPVAVCSKARDYGLSLVGIVGWNPTGKFTYVLSLESVLCCEVEVSATGRSLVQRSPTECGVSECIRYTSKIRARPTRSREQ